MGAVFVQWGGGGPLPAVRRRPRAISVEFGAIANVLPARHLALFIPSDEGSTVEQGTSALVGEWTALMEQRKGRLTLTKRESEVMTLAASGAQTADMAQRLFLSQDTIKSHIQNAMHKLGARTRAHAVAIALVTGQIAWSDDPPPPSASA